MVTVPLGGRPRVQRVPVDVGDGTFYDADIPARVVDLGEVQAESKSCRKYRVVETGKVFLFEPKTGLYFQLDAKTQLQPSTLKPTAKEMVAATSLEGAGEVEIDSGGFVAMLVGNVASASGLLAEAGLVPQPLKLDAKNLPKTEYSAKVLHRVGGRIVIPDLLSLLNEYEGKTSKKLGPVRKAVMRLVDAFRLTPSGAPSLMKVVMDLLVTVSDALVAKMPKIGTGELKTLTYRDEMENRAAGALSGYEQAVNQLTGEVKGVKVGAPQRRKLVDAAYDLGFNFSGFLKRHKNKYGKRDRHEQINLAIQEIDKEVKKLGLKVTDKEGVAAWMAKIGITENVNPLIRDLTRRGLGLDDVDKLVKQIFQDRQRCESTQRGEQLDFLLKAHLKHHPGSVHTVDAKSFRSVEYETGVIDPMLLEAVDRVQVGGNTIPQNAYIERHFTPGVMKFLVDNPSVYVDVYEGKVGGALGDLALMGYTEIRPLSDNSATDFRKLIARNPKSGEVVLVVVGLSGRAYQREIAAHFLYHNPPVNPLRVQMHRLALEDSVQKEFEETLDGLGVVPDVLQMGNVDQVERLLGERKIFPVGDLVAPNLYGKIYVISGKVVFSLKVEPFLYADRAAELLKAVLAKKGSPTVIFTGTAGALFQEMQVGDLVAPETFSQSDTLESQPIEGVKNLALDVLEHKPKKGMFAGGSHGAVDSILFEDQQWFEVQSQKLLIIEQEVAHLARAAAKAKVPFYALFRISDVLGQQDFTQNETDRPEARTPVNQGQVMLAILEKQLGGLKDTGRKPKTGKGVQEKGDKLLFEARDKVYTLCYRTGELMSQVDLETERGFRTRLDDIVSTLRDGEPKELALAVSRLFQLYDRAVPKITVSNPETQVRVQYSGGKPTVQGLGDHADPENVGDKFWVFTTTEPTRGSKLEVIVTADKTSKKVTVTGGRTAFVKFD